MRNRYANAGPQLPMPEIVPTDEIEEEIDDWDYCPEPPEEDDPRADYVYGG